MTTSKVDFGRSEIVDALMIAAMVVVGHEALDLVFQITRQIVVLQEDAVLQGLMPTVQSCLESSGGTEHRGREPGHDVSSISRDRPRRMRTVVGQPPPPMDDLGFAAPRSIERHLECGGDALGLHGGAQLPG